MNINLVVVKVEFYFVKIIPELVNYLIPRMKIITSERDTSAIGFQVHYLGRAKNNRN